MSVRGSRASAPNAPNRGRALQRVPSARVCVPLRRSRFRSSSGSDPSARPYPPGRLRHACDGGQDAASSAAATPGIAVSAGRYRAAPRSCPSVRRCLRRAGARTTARARGSPSGVPSRTPKREAAAPSPAAAAYNSSACVFCSKPASRCQELFPISLFAHRKRRLTLYFDGIFFSIPQCGDVTAAKNLPHP